MTPTPSKPARRARKRPPSLRQINQEDAIAELLAGVMRRIEVAPRPKDVACEVVGIRAAARVLELDLQRIDRLVDERNGQPS